MITIENTINSAVVFSDAIDSGAEGLICALCGSPISKAAALQIEAAIPNFIIHEHHQRALGMEMRNSCKYDYQPVNGRYQVPDLPGIGQEPTEEIIARCDILTIDTYRPYMK